MFDNFVTKHTDIFCCKNERSFCTAKASHIFFNQKYWHILDISIWNFNETLTNPVVSFEQLGTDCFMWEYTAILWRSDYIWVWIICLQMSMDFRSTWLCRQKFCCLLFGSERVKEHSKENRWVRTIRFQNQIQTKICFYFFTHWTRISLSIGVWDFSIPTCYLSLGSKVVSKCQSLLNIAQSC